MVKWKLLITTLPWIAGIVVIALVRDYVFRINGVIDFADVSPLLPVVALIIGFMLAGVLADYKESEKIPGEIATTLETIGDTVQTVIDLNKEADVSQFKPAYRSLVCTVEDWFMRRIGINDCYATLDEFRAIVAKMHGAVGVNYTIRCLGEMHNLRRLVTRVDVIASTSFIPVGYVLLDLLVVTTVVLMLISNYKNLLAEYFLISLFSLIYIYLIRLIRDLDDPFGYASRRGASGAAEVNPYPVREYRRRMEANWQ
jgi:hypothetical protein